MTAFLQQNVMALVALITVAGGFVLLFYRPEMKTEAVALMVMVLGFYFGSSPGSRQKDQVLSDLAQNKGPGA